MQDLDLDELDQAVNNIMTKPRGKRAAQKPAESSDGPVNARPASVVPSRPVAPPDDAPVSGVPEPAAPHDEPVAPPRPSESMHVAVNRPMRVPERRRMHPGAMDIIQPNSAPKLAAPSGRPGRMASALQPTQDIKPEPAAPVAAPEPKREFTAEPASTPQPERHLDTPQDVSDEVLASLSLLEEKKPDTNFLAPDKKFDNPMLSAPEPKPFEAPAEPVKKAADGWPDPLDFHDFGDKSAAPEAPAAEPKFDAPMTAELPAQQPKETPPSLGAEPVSVTDRHDDAATSIGSSPFVTTKVEKRPLGAFADAAHEPAKVALPNQIEAPVPHESTSKSELAEASLESKQHLDAPEQGHDNFDPADLRSMTIPPQYHAAEQKPSDDVHHVFDTKEYHAAPPHMHPAHKGSPALVISIVVLVVLILAAVLVGYFMMTGTFDVTKLW